MSEKIIDEVLLECLRYHEESVIEAKRDHEAMCEDGDDIGFCGALLSVIEQHSRYAKALRTVVEELQGEIKELKGVKHE